MYVCLSCPFNVFLISYQVLNLYGVKYVHIDGDMSFEERSRVVAQFCNDPEIRVLIFSHVGSMGLNLSIAVILIFLVSLHFILFCC